MKNRSKYSKWYTEICNRGRTRSLNSGDYLEKHHVIPTFLFKNNKRALRYSDGFLEGDPDSISNITLLTPREHFIAHILLHKMFYKTKWSYRMGSALILFYSSKDMPSHPRNKIFSPSDSKKYDWCKRIGRESISKARTGKMPVIDSITGEMIGSVEIDHPKVISGKWVHHSKGKHSYVNQETGEKIFTRIDDEILKDPIWKAVSVDNTGEKNPRYSGITDSELEDFYYRVSKICKDEFGKKIIPPLKFVASIWNELNDTSWPTLSGGLRSGFRFNGDVSNLYSRSISLGLEYSPRAKYFSKDIDIEKLKEIIKCP